jgi:hypothetical protein
MTREIEDGVKIQKENVTESHEIERLCAAVRMTGYPGGTLFVGWDKTGVPAISTKNTSLSEQARNSYNITKSVPFPYGRESANLPIEVVEFVGSSRPFDRKDTEDELTQDILTYWVTRGVAESEQLQVQELDMLEAILNGRLVWEDFNENAMSSDEKIRGQNMYTLFLPTNTPNKKQVMYIITFRPPMKNESNESMYRQFLIQTFTTLAKIDQDQPPEKRKGYLQAIGLDGEGAENSAEGGLLAVGVLDILRTKFPNLFRLSDSRLNQIKRDSDGKSIADQTKIILREFGLYNMPSAPHSPADLESYSVEALTAVAGMAYKLASRAINK